MIPNNSSLCHNLKPGIANCLPAAGFHAQVRQQCRLRHPGDDPGEHPGPAAGGCPRRRRPEGPVCAALQDHAAGMYYRITLLPCPWPNRRRHCKFETSLADLPCVSVCEQGLAYLPGGVCRSSMGRQASYEQAVAWKVVGDDGAPQCLALMLVNWTFI